MEKFKTKYGEVEWNGNEVLFIATKDTITAMKKACIYVQGKAKRLISKPGGRLVKMFIGRGKMRIGKTVKRGEELHFVSEPGNPPARDTGVLMSSVSYEVKLNKPFVSGRVGPDLDVTRKSKTGKSTDPEYGAYLEFGTSKMAARPWLFRTIEACQDKIIEIFKKAILG